MTLRQRMEPHVLAVYQQQARKMALDEPIEVRLANPRLGNKTLVLWASVSDRGTINSSLAVEGHGQAESLSNLQATATFPRKVVPGWQVEVVTFAASGLYDITEVR